MLLGQGSPRGSHPWGETMLAAEDVDKRSVSGPAQAAARVASSG